MRRQAPLHDVETRLGARVIALVDERSGLLVVDVEQVILEAVALRDGARVRHDFGRFRIAPVDEVPVRELRGPPHLHQRRHLRVAQDGLDARDERGRGAPSVFQLM